MEELGIRVHLEMIDKLAVDYGSECEIIGIFAGVTGQEPKIDKKEVEQIKRFDFEEVTADFTNKKFDLSGGSRDSFAHILKTGSLRNYKENIENR